MFQSLSSSGVAAMAKLTGTVPAGGNDSSSNDNKDDTEDSQEVGLRRRRCFAPLPVKGNTGRRGNYDRDHGEQQSSTNGSSADSNVHASNDSSSDDNSDGDSYYSGNSSSSQSSEEEDMEPLTNHTSNVSKAPNVEDLMDQLRHKDKQINRLQRALDHHHKKNLTNGDHRHRTIQTTPYNDTNDMDDSALSRDDISTGTVGTMGTVHTHVEEIAEKLGEGLGNAGDAIESALSNFKQSMSSGSLANVAVDVTRGITRSLSGDGGPVPLSSMRRSAGGSAANLLDRVVPGRIARSRSSGTISKILAEQRSRNTGTINVNMMQQRNANSLTANGSVTSGSTGSFMSRSRMGAGARSGPRKSAWQEVRDLTATVEDLQQQVKGKDTALGTLVRVKKILDEKIEAQEARIAALQQEKEQQRAQIQQQQLEKEQQEKQQVVQEEQQQECQPKHPEKGEPQTLGPSHQKLEALEQKLRKQSEQLERIKLERDELVQDNEQLTAQKEELEQENQELLQDAEESTMRTDSMTRQHQKLSHNLGNSLQQKEQMGFSLQQLVQEKESLVQEKEELKAQIKREAATAKNAQEEAAQHANTALEAQESAALAARQLQELQDQLKQQQNSVPTNQRDASLVMSGNYGDSVKNQIAAAKATLGKLNAKHKSLHQNLESAQQCLCDTRDGKLQR